MVDGKDTTTQTTTSNTITTPITTPTPTPNDTKDTKDTKAETSDKINVVTTSTSNESDKNKTSAIEGFDLQSTENNIKRGKQSNSIPVNQYYKQSIEVAPYEEPGFSNLFGLL